MDRLKESKEARIVNVSSLAHTMPPNKLDMDDLFFEKKKYNEGTDYM